MPNIVVSDYAYQTIMSKAAVPFEAAGQQRPNGQWEVFVSNEYIGRISPKMLLGESVGEAIARWYPA